MAWPLERRFPRYDALLSAAAGIAALLGWLVVDRTVLADSRRRAEDVRLLAGPTSPPGQREVRPAAAMGSLRRRADEERTALAELLRSAAPERGEVGRPEAVRTVAVRAEAARLRAEFPREVGQGIVEDPDVLGLVRTLAGALDASGVPRASVLRLVAGPPRTNALDDPLIDRVTYHPLSTSISLDAARLPALLDALRATRRPRLLLRRLRTVVGVDPGRLRLDLDFVAASVDLAGAVDLGRVEYDEDEGWEPVDLLVGRNW